MTTAEPTNAAPAIDREIKVMSPHHGGAPSQGKICVELLQRMVVHKNLTADEFIFYLQYRYLNLFTS